MNGLTEVVIRGYPGTELAASFAGFEVTSDPDGLTHLVGRVDDQPALLALLSTLDDLHIAVVAVRTGADVVPPSSSTGEVGGPAAH